MTEHLIIDLNGLRKSPVAMGSMEELVRDFLLHLCSAINMKALGSPAIYRGSDHLPGVTGFQVFETSHASVHHFENTNQMWIDVCSCKSFSIDIVLALIDLYFPSDNINIQAIRRWPIKGVTSG